MQNAPDADVIVVGGGISGLACAWGLQRRGANVRLIESAPRAGGCIATVRRQGYLLEAGPNSALDTSPRVARLLDELGIAAERVDANPAARNRYVVRNGVPIALPMSPLAFLTSPLFSAAAKLRLFGEPFRSRGSAADESVAAFVRRRLGGEFLDYAINPFVGGVYAGRPEELCVRAAFPRLYELEQQYGSLIRGQVLGARRRARESQKSKHTASMFSFRGGMETVTAAMARQLRHVELNAAVSGIAADGGGFALSVDSAGTRRTLRAPSVVMAVPAYAAAPLIRPLLPAAAAALQGVPYPPVAVVYCGFHRNAVGHPLDGFGMLVPQYEGRRILGSIFSSTLFEQRAQTGHVLLTTFIGGSRQPELVALEDDELAALVRTELAKLLGAGVAPDFCEVRRWRQAIPQYTLGHGARMDALNDAERAIPGLFFCANYRGGISISDCIQSADRVATAGYEFLGRSGAAG